jgi:1-deoxyxylulose-5-phosphate synthase
MTFGNQCDEHTSFEIMECAAASGVNFIDTADAYPFPASLETAGKTEEIVGNWLKGRREDFVLATKCGMRVGNNPNDFGLSRKHVLAAIDSSLRRLKTDYVDLYQVHFPDPHTPIEETLSALDRVVESGKARYIGCSNFQAWQLCKALWMSDRLGLERFDSIQPRYNLLYRDIENELIPLCLDQDVGVMVYNPLAGGFLTGKYNRDKPPADNTRFAVGAQLYRGRYWNSNCFDAVDALRAFFEPRGKSLAHVALAWVLKQPAVTSAIVGATSLDQLRDSLRGVELELDAREMERCNDVWFNMGDVVEVRPA